MFYSVALFAHILGVTVYFAAFGVVYVCIAGLRRAWTVQSLRLWLGVASRATRVLAASAVLILLAGIYLVAVAWHWQTAWVLIALAAFIGVGVTFGQLFGSRFAALGKGIHGLPDDALLPATLTALTRDRSLWLATNAVGALLLGIVFLMTVKPGALGSMVALAVALALGSATGLLLERQPMLMPAREQ